LRYGIVLGECALAWVDLGHAMEAAASYLLEVSPDFV
jgi:hypothetical protein